MIDRLIDRPIPIPSAFVVKKASKSLSTLPEGAAGRPRPRSRTAISTISAPKAEVWIGRFEGERLRLLGSADALRAGRHWAEIGQEANFLLVGRGDGEMIVGGVHEDYVNRKVLTVGDLVISAGTSAELPVVMVIGHVEQIEDDPAQRQLRQLVVRCPLDTSRLRWVYVVDVPPRDKNDAK